MLSKFTSPDIFYVIDSPINYTYHSGFRNVILDTRFVGAIYVSDVCLHWIVVPKSSCPFDGSPFRTGIFSCDSVAWWSPMLVFTMVPDANISTDIGTQKSQMLDLPSICSHNRMLVFRRNWPHINALHLVTHWLPK